jgi:hypothetical protein
MPGTKKSPFSVSRRGPLVPNPYGVKIWYKPVSSIPGSNPGIEINLFIKG